VISPFCAAFTEIGTVEGEGGSTMREPILAGLVTVEDRERRPLGRPAILRSMEQPMYVWA
jgi:hypothetical protein